MVLVGYLVASRDYLATLETFNYHLFSFNRFNNEIPNSFFGALWTDYRPPLFTLLANK